MQAEKGIDIFGQRAVAEIFKEYRQINDMNTMGDIDQDTLTIQQKKDALRATNLIREKRCDKIKRLTFADGRPQRKYIPCEEVASPTISQEA